MHTYNCTKGQKPLEPSHILTMRHTRIHMHSHSHTHTIIYINHIHTYDTCRYKVCRERERETKKITLDQLCTWTDWFCFINSRIEHVMTMKGRMMSKVVYVRECPLYSVFWNVSIKCYILCTFVLHFITHTREKIDVQNRNVVAEHWLVSLQIRKKYNIPCSKVLLFNTNHFV